MPKGDCFPKAIEVADALAAQKCYERIRVVHGLPVNQSAAHLGRRYWHAWVEYRDGDETLVHDESNDRKFVMPRDHYYIIGHLDEQHVWRYSRRDAARRMLRTDQYGPWVLSWERMEEVSS